jgi:hypothetical protein
LRLSNKWSNDTLSLQMIQLNLFLGKSTRSAPKVSTTVLDRATFDTAVVTNTGTGGSSETRIAAKVEETRVNKTILPKV